MDFGFIHHIIHECSVENNENLYYFSNVSSINQNNSNGDIDQYQASSNISDKSSNISIFNESSNKKTTKIKCKCKSYAQGLLLSRNKNEDFTKTLEKNKKNKKNLDIESNIIDNINNSFKEEENYYNYFEALGFKQNSYVVN